MVLLKQIFPSSKTKFAMRKVPKAFLEIIKRPFFRRFVVNAVVLNILNEF